MKKVLSLTAAALALAACAPAGSTPEPTAAASSGSTELTMLVFETPNLTPKYWDEGIARAAAKVPGVKIKKLVSPTVDRTAYAKQLAASGQLPDIMVAVDQGGFADAGQLAPFSPEELKDYVNPVNDTIGGKTYALPDNTQPTPLVYYNKKLFADGGVSEPKTYAELLAVSEKLKAKGTTPFIVGGGGGDTWASAYPLIATVATEVYKSDPEWLAKLRKGEAKFSDPAFVKAAQKVADLAKKGYIPASGLSRNYVDTEKAFLDGKGAMYPMGSWFAAAADNNKPSFEVGVFAWPSDDGSRVIPRDIGGGIVVTSGKNAELAKKFAIAFSLDKDNIDAGVKNDAAIPAIKGYTPPAGLGPVYQATFDLYKDAEGKGEAVNAFSIEAGDAALLPGMADKVNAAAQDLIIGKKAVADVVKGLESEWEKASS